MSNIWKHEHIKRTLLPAISCSILVLIDGSIELTSHELGGFKFKTKRVDAVGGSESSSLKVDAYEST